MKFSIITPSLNQGEYIEQCILSVLEQNYNDFEHIIIDGGSTDDTITILKKYHHLKWISEKDKGQSNALNKGFLISCGEIIGWLNCDEKYLPNTFTKIDNYFQKESIDVLYGNYVSSRKGCEKTVFGVPHFPMLLFWKQYINTVALFFSKKIITNKEFIDESLEATMDKEFLLRLSNKKYRFKYVNETFGCFYWHSENKSTKIRNIQKIESRKIITKYFFKNKIFIDKLFFWPIKYLFDFINQFYKRIIRILY